MPSNGQNPQVIGFPNMTNWHEGHFKHVKVQGGKSGQELFQSA